ncbi:hypothetical protein HS088_TW11G00654 [Tripterygium wilfordii]|nr:acyltransferase-like protein At1g54570, chloroplastic [Tripterygium wilfordii]XP_038714922.1 acyltransferase-like protein At1g54570, chloroplastic [Tripterygium wilfordii]XP_038714930.1 acyltransferase-like protein At1g54570, chloroplastic [Tripterygium wilfordii]XP_038714931.1 acyltransferase-like protein At1g54570, chloroplastic [Tripterygium wilfordii]KAF5740580.1 hypothetical protein HS088_TW11G00654 [Tripterygium wilfordii]
MTARFGATIVPFGAIGEDDMFELALDYNDYMKIPMLNDYIRDASRKSMRIRDESFGEVASQDIFVPGILPKIYGWFNYLFRKPIETKGMEEALKDKENAKQLYDQIKYEVESNIAYLLKKREEDPYRNTLDRTLYRMLHSPLHEVPAFKP